MTSVRRKKKTKEKYQDRYSTRKKEQRQNGERAGGQGEATRGRSTEGVAALEWREGQGGVRKKSEKKEAPHIAEPGAALWRNVQ